MIGVGKYISIQSWMLDGLPEMNMNAIVVYALIYGFSQDGKTRFTGSREYIREWTRLSVRSISSILDSLCEQGLIHKRSYAGEDGGTRNEFWADLQKAGEIISEVMAKSAREIPAQEVKRTPARKKAEFVPPTLDEINAWCKQKGYNIDTQYFHEYYSEKGWKVKKDGKEKPMDNWKLTLATWAKNSRKWESNGNGKKAGNVSKAVGFVALGAAMDGQGGRNDKAGNW